MLAVQNIGKINILCKCLDNVSNAWVQYLFYRGFYAWFLVSPRFLCRLTALIMLLLLNGNSNIINAVKRQRNLGLVFGVRVGKFAVGVNGVCVEMVPVLVYIN